MDEAAGQPTALAAPVRAQWYVEAGRTRWYEDGRTHMRDTEGDDEVDDRG
ncbi:hypothetical protein OG436_29310 [Streptomyces caniferus]|nr:hypothetical protein [Streptomyces caniferus]